MALWIYSNWTGSWLEHLNPAEVGLLTRKCPRFQPCQKTDLQLNLQKCRSGKILLTFEISLQFSVISQNRSNQYENWIGYENLCPPLYLQKQVLAVVSLVTWAVVQSKDQMLKNKLPCSSNNTDWTESFPKRSEKYIVR